MNYRIVIIMAGKYPKAIDGFKQLSGKDDSLSQHAMYLLGDSYLKVGRESKCKKCIFILCIKQQQYGAKGNFKISVCKTFL